MQRHKRQQLDHQLNHQERHARHARSGERGFTLTELLVALTVTIIGLAGLLSLHVTTVKGNATAGHAAEAIGVAEQTVEMLRTLPVKTIETRFQTINGTEWSPAEVLTVETGRNGQEYQPVLFAVEVAGQPGLVRFRVVVYWMEAGAAMPAATALESDADHRLEVQFIRTRVEAL